jgi:hypothetical protein
MLSGMQALLQEAQQLVRPRTSPQESDPLSLYRSHPSAGTIAPLSAIFFPI